MTIDEVKKVCILGAGTMGIDISLTCAGRGYEAAVYEVSEEALRRAPTRQKERLATLASVGAISQSEQGQMEAGLLRISFTADAEKAAENADLLIEAVPEDIPLKRKVHAQFEKLLPAHAIMTTNTSSLLVSDIEDAISRGDKFAALHFHGVQALVDIMRGPRTSPETVGVLERFTRSLGRVPMVMKKERRGYVHNTLLGGLLRAALELVLGGYADVQDVDRAYMLVTGLPYGPFGMMDGIGLDIIVQVASSGMNVTEELDPQQVIDFWRPYVERGELGVKTGKGFYTYPNPAFRQPDFLTGEVN